VSRSVLIVDDHAGFRSWARVLLEMQGYTVVGDVEDGASAVAAVRSLRPDVVLLDVRLPDIDGFEVIRRLAREGIAACVVLVSSRDAEDFGGALEHSGAQGFVAKAELSAAALDAVLARYRMSDHDARRRAL
jgi:DNA-binding NarL/FixJ family response regulator